MDHLPRMYTPAECADVWRVKPDNVPAMCRRMGIGVYRLGPHAVRIDADDFDRATLDVLLQCLFDRFGSVFPQCGLMVFPGVVIVSR